MKLAIAYVQMWDIPRYEHCDPLDVYDIVEIVQGVITLCTVQGAETVAANTG